MAELHPHSLNPREKDYGWRRQGRVWEAALRMVRENRQIAIARNLTGVWFHSQRRKGDFWGEIWGLDSRTWILSSWWGWAFRKSESLGNPSGDSGKWEHMGLYSGWAWALALVLGQDEIRISEQVDVQLIPHALTASLKKSRCRQTFHAGHMLGAWECNGAGPYGAFPGWTPLLVMSPACLPFAENF